MSAIWVGADLPPRGVPTARAFRTLAISRRLLPSATPRRLKALTADNSSSIHLRNRKMKLFEKQELRHSIQEELQ
jgi:hypothetical protein